MQLCSEPSVVCLGDAEDRQIEESCNNQDVKEQRQRQESLWHLWTEDDDGYVNNEKLVFWQRLR